MCGLDHRYSVNGCTEKDRIQRAISIFIHFHQEARSGVKCIELTVFCCSRIAAVLIRATASDCASADPLSSAGKTVALPLSYTRAVLVYPGKFPGNRENNREFGKTDYLR